MIWRYSLPTIQRVSLWAIALIASSACRTYLRPPDTEETKEIATPSFQAQIPAAWLYNDVYGTGEFVLIDPLDVEVPDHGEPNAAIAVVVESRLLSDVFLDLSNQLDGTFETGQFETSSSAEGGYLVHNSEFLGSHVRKFSCVSLGEKTITATADLGLHGEALDAFVDSIQEGAQ